MSSSLYYSLFNRFRTPPLIDQSRVSRVWKCCWPQSISTTLQRPFFLFAVNAPQFINYCWFIFFSYGCLFYLIVSSNSLRFSHSLNYSIFTVHRISVKLFREINRQCILFCKFVCLKTQNFVGRSFGIRKYFSRMYITSILIRRVSSIL